MNRIKNALKYVILIGGIVFSHLNAHCQKSIDSLSLTYVISTVIQSHPSIKEGMEAINASEANIGLAKSGYYPTVDVSASYSRLGPVQELTFPGFGTFQLFPANNYTANVNLYQSLYDFGKTAKNVDFAKENKNLTQQNLEHIKQKLAFSTSMLFYSIGYIQQAIKMNREQLNTLAEHLQFIEKKKVSGSATAYEILSTQVKISAIESAGIDLQTALKNQISQLNSLMGNKIKTQLLVIENLEVQLPDMIYDSLILFAFQHRDELKITREKAVLANLKYKMVKAQENPSLNLQLSGGGKNGYIPDLNKFTPNFVAGLGLKIPIFQGTRLKFNLLQVKTTIAANDFETEIAQRNIEVEVTESIANLEASLKKTERNTLQLNQSKEAYQLAQKSFSAGTITNLDLLDAATQISESNLSLLKSKVEYTINVIKLKLAIGERLY